mmetsp:Transcript_38693/g.101088  ORF Transcript_38693/g.101088 Transcript_38693/m.101088 type:complete len:234 (-) Transcript_38693:2152-2853(-)
MGVKASSTASTRVLLPAATRELNFQVCASSSSLLYSRSANCASTFSTFFSTTSFSCSCSCSRSCSASRLSSSASLDAFSSSPRFSRTLFNTITGALESPPLSRAASRALRASSASSPPPSGSSKAWMVHKLCLRLNSSRCASINPRLAGTASCNLKSMVSVQISRAFRTSSGLSTSSLASPRLCAPSPMSLVTVLLAANACCVKVSRVALRQMFPRSWNCSMVNRVVVVFNCR